jgi:Zn ribbon nucleic-acid-binding protein
MAANCPECAGHNGFELGDEDQEGLDADEIAFECYDCGFKWIEILENHESPETNPDNRSTGTEVY